MLKGDKTMPITMEQVLRRLSPDEPNYTYAAQMGAEALPHLLVLVRGNDAMIASKAAYLAGLINGDLSVDVLCAAAESPIPEVRIACAATVRHLSRVSSTKVIRKLEKLSDPGVQKLLKR
jgi:hypothetical protein